MIDPDTIEDIDDCDGESVLAYGFDTEKGEWSWGWIWIDILRESGRTDIIERIFPYEEDAA